MIDQVGGRKFFQMVDRKDAAEYASYFVEDGQVVFGNDAPITGKATIEPAMTGFYSGLQSMRHDIENVWITVPDTIVSQAVAVYVQKNGREVRLPVVTVLTLEPATEKVRRAQFYLDLTPLRAE